MMREKQQMKYLTLVIHRDMALIRRRIATVKNIATSKLYTKEGLIIMGVVSLFMIKKSNRISRAILEVAIKLRDNVIKLVMSGLVFQVKSHMIKLNKQN